MILKKTTFTLRYRFTCKKKWNMQKEGRYYCLSGGPLGKLKSVSSDKLELDSSYTILAGVGVAGGMGINRIKIGGAVDCAFYDERYKNSVRPWDFLTRMSITYLLF